MTDNRLTIIYTNIGRGHPFYLDGIVEELARSERRTLFSNATDVFELSSGLSKLAWRLARMLYCRGTGGGPLGAVYRRLRSSGDYNKTSPGLWLLGRDLRAAVGSTSARLLVAHPSLVGILRGHHALIYQHGELVAPRDSIVKGASTVLVPTPEVAETFLGANYREDQLFVSHLCIEPGLVPQSDDCFRLRMSRLGTTATLTGGFFSSGAEPPAHVDLICRAAISIAKSGGRGIIFARKSGLLEREIIRRFADAGIDLAHGHTSDNHPAACLLLSFADRAEENLLTTRFFRHLDYFVAPSHERVNWSVGLGLPMFVLWPLIGPFSPLNAKLVQDEGVASELRDSSDADRFSDLLLSLQNSGRLAAMAERGWGHRQIDGFSRIADYLCGLDSDESRS